MEEEQIKSKQRKSSVKLENESDIDVVFIEDKEASSSTKHGIDNGAYLDGDDGPTKYFVSLEQSKNLNVVLEDIPSETSSVVDNRSMNVLATSSSWKEGTNNDFVVKKRRPFQISYESIVWFVFAATTVLCIVDRFVNKGDYVLERSGKRVSKMWGATFAETATNVIWAITARLIITSQNLMFYTTLWCFPNLLSECAPRFIKVGGIRDIHIKMHRIAGIFLIAIPSLAHVLVIFLPPFVNKSELTFHPPSAFNYSKQPGHLNWTKFWDPAALESWSFNDVKGIHLTADELYRLCLMVALFCVIFPLSRSQYLNHRSYSTAVTVHTIAGIWYAVDNIRKITHSLAHVMNLPLLVLWCIDRLLSIVYYHSSPTQIVKKSMIGDKYIEVRLKLDENCHKGIGDVYYLSYRKTKFGLPAFERSHPFTSFSNHSTDTSWDVGFLLSIMDDDDQWFPAWTRRMVNAEELEGNLPLQAWGPYRSSSFQLFKNLFEDEENNYLLFASGSGIGYLLDTLGVLAHKTKTKKKDVKLNIYYTVRDMTVIEQLYGTVLLLISDTDHSSGIEINFHWYCTDDADDYDFVLTTHENISMNKGRINFDKVISSAERSTSVYFVGRPSIADAIEKICNKYGIIIHKDYVNSQRGKSDKSLMIQYFKKSLVAIAIAVVFCFALSIYVHI